MLPFLKALREHPIPNLSTDSVLTFKLDSLDEHVSCCYIIACITLNVVLQVFTFPLPNPRRLPEIPTDVKLIMFLKTFFNCCFFFIA